MSANFGNFLKLVEMLHFCFIFTVVILMMMMVMLAGWLADKLNKLKGNVLKSRKVELLHWVLFSLNVVWCATKRLEAG